MAGIWFHRAWVLAESFLDYVSRRLHFFRNRIAGGGAARDDRGSVRANELHYAANVVALGHFLLVGKVSPGLSTLHQSPAANRTQYCSSRCDERRRIAVGQLASSYDTDCLVSA